MKKNFVNFFQSVLTVGVVTEGDDWAEAKEKAVEHLDKKRPLRWAYISQTPFEWSDTDEIDPSTTKKHSITITDGMKQIIASHLGIPIDSLMDEDYSNFVHGLLFALNDKETV